MLIISVTYTDSLAGQLSPFTCSSPPELIEQMNPGLKIPSCQSSQNLRFLSDFDGITSAVFVSCHDTTLESCTNIAKAILQHPTGATLNIVVQQRHLKLPPFERKFKELSQLAIHGGTKLNIIPIKLPVPIFLRDPGRFQTHNGKTTYVANPYWLDGIFGSWVMNEIMNACGIHFESTAESGGSFSKLYEKLSNLNDSEFDQNYRKERQKNLSSDSFGSADMGGNFIALPGGGIAVGFNSLFKPEKKIVKYYSEKNPLLMLKIPTLTVSHIDEVFNIIPSNDSCGYKLLRAAPLEFQKILKSLSKNLEIGVIDDLELEVDEQVEAPIITRLMELESLAKKAARNNLVIRDKVKREILDLSLKAAKTIKTTRNVNEITKMSPLKNEWVEATATIKASTDQLIQFIQKTTKKKCTPEIIDLPVAWGKNGWPIVANPINGLWVNGFYFYSEPFRVEETPVKIKKKGYEKYVNQKKVVPFPELHSVIRAKLKKIFGNKAVAVNTFEYDEGNGNFHCATTNMVIPCKTNR